MDSSREVERLQGQVNALDRALREKNERVELDARRDMILALGETLQGAYRNKECEKLLDDSVAGIVLALGAGNAQRFGKVGAVVDFNRAIHQRESGSIKDGKVKVVAPGIKVSNYIYLRAIVVNA